MNESEMWLYMQAKTALKNRSHSVWSMSATRWVGRG